MSLDELRNDFKQNVAEAKRCKTFDELREHVVNTMWPFIEAKLDVIEEIDDAVAELVDQAEDYLHGETAAIFAALVQSSLGVSAELRKRAAGDDILMKKLDAHEQLCHQAMATLGEITMVAPDEETDDDDGDEEDADDEEVEGE